MKRGSFINLMPRTKRIANERVASRNKAAGNTAETYATCQRNIMCPSVKELDSSVSEIGKAVVVTVWEQISVEFKDGAISAG